jgi:hypothetical protein
MCLLVCPAALVALAIIPAFEVNKSEHAALRGPSQPFDIAERLSGSSATTYLRRATLVVDGYSNKRRNGRAGPAENLSESNQVSVVCAYHVIVVGGGIAGVSA